MAAMKLKENFLPLQRHLQPNSARERRAKTDQTWSGAVSWGPNDFPLFSQRSIENMTRKQSDPAPDWRNKLALVFFVRGPSSTFGHTKRVLFLNFIACQIDSTPTAVNNQNRVVNLEIQKAGLRANHPEDDEFIGFSVPR
jgi:hypothetical protein